MSWQQTLGNALRHRLYSLCDYPAMAVRIGSSRVGCEMEDRASAVGRRVRYWRQRRNLDRKQLADMVGRSTSWLDKIEKGERSLLRLPMLERVAEVLSIVSIHGAG